MAWVALDVEGSEDEAEGTAGGSFGPAASEKVFLEVEGCFLLPATTGTDAGAAADELPEAAAATPAATLAALDTPLPVSIFFDLGAIALSALAEVGGREVLYRLTVSLISKAREQNTVPAFSLDLEFIE
jgi:hypothetical protein